MKTFVVGDIHGGFKAFLQCLEHSEFDNKKDKLILLGDYVDGWSESAELIEFLINLQKESDDRHIFIRGNHDKWCQDWLMYGRSDNIWKQQGGQATIESYVRTAHIVSDEHRQFFTKLLNFYIDEQNRGFVHGGFRSRKGLGHEVYQSDYYWDRDLWSLAMMAHGRNIEIPNLVKDSMSNSLRFFRHKEIYIGHTATENWNVKPHYKEYEDLNQPKNGSIIVPMNRCNIWNLDTGAGFNGKLTIMDIDTKEYFQSDFVKELYPNERGR